MCLAWRLRIPDPRLWEHANARLYSRCCPGTCDRVIIEVCRSAALLGVPRFALVG